MLTLTRQVRAIFSLLSPGRGLARPPATIAMAVFMVSASAVALFLFDDGSDNQAEASGPSMAIQVYEDKDKTMLVCDVGVVGRKCDVTGGSSFSLDILASSPPASGFSAYRIVLQYSANLNIVQQPGVEENRAPICDLPNETKNSGLYTLSCKIVPSGSGEVSDYSGVLANVHFACKPEFGAGQIDIVGGLGAGASVYTQPGTTDPVPIYLKSQDKGGKPVVDSVEVNCIPPTPTNTHNADRHVDSNAHAHADPYGHAHEDTHRHEHVYRDADAQLYGFADIDQHSDADRDQIAEDVADRLRRQGQDRPGLWHRRTRPEVQHRDRPEFQRGYHRQRAAAGRLQRL